MHPWKLQSRLLVQKYDSCSEERQTLQALAISTNLSRRRMPALRNSGQTSRLWRGRLQSTHSCFRSILANSLMRIFGFSALLTSVMASSSPLQDVPKKVGGRFRPGPYWPVITRFLGEFPSDSPCLAGLRMVAGGFPTRFLGSWIRVGGVGPRLGGSWPAARGGAAP